MEPAAQIKNLTVAHELTLRFGSILNLSELVRELAAAACELSQCDRALVLLADNENATLSVAAATGLPRPELTFSIYNPTDPALIAWLDKRPFAALRDDLAPDSVLANFVQILDTDRLYSIPLHEGDILTGVIIVSEVNNPIFTATPASALLGAAQESAAIALANARLHSQIVSERDAKMRELEMMRQIDRELSDTIQLGHAFDLTLDWAQRFTLAQFAILSIYDQLTDELRCVAAVGYSIPTDQLFDLIADDGGVTRRVARSGYAEMIPDVRLDSDYTVISSAVRSHMSVPVTREDRVIAVITLESRSLNAFTDEHADFVSKLAARAGVAIDNARLYAESVLEREKLARILSAIADVVIVVGNDNRVVLMNQSALAVLQLPTDRDYVGMLFTDALEGTPLLSLFRRVRLSEQIAAEEVQIGEDRTFYAEFAPHADIGWIIILHDITPLKQTDELKRELVATVSHDLKQPLSVMSGSLELLQMSSQLDARGSDLAVMISMSIEHMRHLIDDVLDLAKIESGMELQIDPVPVVPLLRDCLERILPLAQIKAMQIETDVAPNLPQLAGDRQRLLQIFSNIIGNAVKYTPPSGHVYISVENADCNLRFIVQDDGLGISPEDQAHIFDRFYRVRRAETEGIEGTGLGLAIVKKLIDVHNGQIGLESSLGEGTTFYVTLPTYQA